MEHAQGASEQPPAAGAELRRPLRPGDHRGRGWERMKVDLIRLFDQDVDELVEIFIPIVLAWTRKTLIPELYEVFGAECLMRFLDVFAGTRFEVPSREVIMRALRDAEIYHGLVTRRESPAGLARRFDIEERAVEETAARVAGLLDGNGVHHGNGHRRRAERTGR